MQKLRKKWAISEQNQLRSDTQTDRQTDGYIDTGEDMRHSTEQGSKGDVTGKTTFRNF